MLHFRWTAAWFVACCWPASSLIVRFQPSTDEILTKTLLLPVQVHRLLQDPQNIPHNDERFFTFKSGGRLSVDLKVLRPPKAALGSKRKPKHSLLSFNPSDFALLDSIPSDSGLTRSAEEIGGWDGRSSIGANVLTPSFQAVANATTATSVDCSLSSCQQHAVPKSQSLPLEAGGLIIDQFGHRNLIAIDSQKISIRLSLRSVLERYSEIFGVPLFGKRPDEEILHFSRPTGRRAPRNRAGDNTSSPTPPPLVPSALQAIAHLANFPFRLFASLEGNGAGRLSLPSGESLHERSADVADPSRFEIAARWLVTNREEQISHRSPNVADDRTYIFLFNEEQWNRFLADWTASHITDNPASVDRPFTSYLRSSIRVPIVRNKVQFSSIIQEAGPYYLVFLNPTARPLQLSGTIELVNPNGCHLSVSEFHQAAAVQSMFFLNFLSAAGLSICLLTCWRETKTDLHALMTLSFVIRALYLLLDWSNVEAFALKGELEPINWVLPRMVSKVQDIVALMLFLLVSFGWKVHRQRLSMLETRALAGVCVVSFYLGVFEVSMNAFQAIRYIIHSLAYLIVIVAINFNIALLGTMLTETGLSRSTAEIYQKREGYWAFRIIFIIFILKPTLLLFYKLTVLSDTDEEDWILVVLDNILDWSIGLALVIAFRPVQNFLLFEALQIEDAQERVVPLPVVDPTEGVMQP